MGVVWIGPLAPSDTLHYATLDVGTLPDGRPVMTLRRTARDPSWEQISERRTEAIILEYMSGGSCREQTQN